MKSDAPVTPAIECTESLATGEIVRFQHQPGLTKRELFAALVLAQLAGAHPPSAQGKSAEYIARDAVHCADALLAELAK